VGTYIGSIQDAVIRNLAKKTRTLIRKSVPELDESLKMGIPCYRFEKTMVAAIGDYSKHVNLYFMQGAKLSSNRLEGSGKGMRHIKIAKESDIDPIEFSRLLKEAVAIAQ
jgi:hypothetical protein